MEKASKEPLVSVIVPIYNVEKYLALCVDSIIAQTYKNLEIILVDDGSTDRCPEICERYAKEDNRVVVIHKRNGGVSSARNTGILSAKAKYITFVDSDDYVDRNYISTLVNEIIIENADIAITSHYIEYQNKKPIVRYAAERKVLTPHDAISRFLYDDGIDVSPWGKMYKTKLFKNIRYPEGRIFEDTAITPLLIMKAKRIAINNTPTYHYTRYNLDSITNRIFSSSKFELITATKTVCEIILNKYPDLQKGVERRTMFAYLATLRQMVGAKRVDKKQKKELIKYINNNRKNILRDNAIQQRDRIALLSTILGYPGFAATWKIYTLVTNRRNN